jgi:hypothetical protein
VPSCLFDGYFRMTLDVVLVFDEIRCGLKYVSFFITRASSNNSLVDNQRNCLPVGLNPLIIQLPNNDLKYLL